MLWELRLRFGKGMECNMVMIENWDTRIAMETEI